MSIWVCKITTNIYHLQIKEHNNVINLHNNLQLISNNLQQSNTTHYIEIIYFNNYVIFLKIIQKIISIYWVKAPFLIKTSTFVERRHLFFWRCSHSLSEGIFFFGGVHIHSAKAFILKKVHSFIERRHLFYWRCSHSLSEGIIIFRNAHIHSMYGKLFFLVIIFFCHWNNKLLVSL